MAKTDETSETKKSTVSAWKKAALHEVLLPSNFRVTIKIPNIPELIKTGQVPNELVQAAVAASSGNQEVTKELLEEQADFYRLLISKTVVEPEIEESDYDDLPYEDIEMLVELATRQRDIDAEYKHIGGLHASESWRSFRGFEASDENVAGV